MVLFFERTSERAGLNEKPSQEQNAQDYQNRDDDDFDQAHNGFLSRNGQVARKERRWTHILRASRTGCQRHPVSGLV